MRTNTLVAALILMCGAASETRADPIVVQGGSDYLVLNTLAHDGTRWSSGSLFFPPDHATGVFGRELFVNARSGCEPCAPGDLLDLSASFQLRGPSFLSGGPVLSVWGLGVLNFTTPTVEVPLPPSDPRLPIVVVAPFQFDAQIHLFGEPGTVPVFSGDLVGGGIARALLVGSGTSWSFAQLEYAFTDQTPVPEPGTMLLVLGGLAALMRKRVG
jgi:hypothetical protein